MSFVTAHVLDAVSGSPAAGLDITLCDSTGQAIASAATNSDGRVPELGPESLDPGTYRIIFSTGNYFAGRAVKTFYPSVTVDFTVEAGQGHYHIPLLLSPYSYMTYRGS